MAGNVDKNNYSRKQNHASAIAHPCLRESALAGKVKPRDYTICVPYYRVPEKDLR